MLTLRKVLTQDDGLKRKCGELEGQGFNTCQSGPRNGIHNKFLCFFISFCFVDHFFNCYRWVYLDIVIFFFIIVSRWGFVEDKMALHAPTILLVINFKNGK